MSHPLAYVAKVFPRTSETFVLNELRALEELGESPIVFSLHRNPQPVTHALLSELRAPKEIVDEIDVDDRRVRRASERLADLLGVSVDERARILPRKYVRLAVALADRAQHHGVRHLHAHFASRAGHVSALASMLAGIGYSMTAHAKDIYHRDVDHTLLSWKLRHARFVVTVTEFNRRHLLELLGDPGAASVVRLYNGVDLRRFLPPEAAPTGVPRIVSIGRLVEKKGFGVLVDACAELRERGASFRCEILGGGELEAELRERISRHGLGDVVILAGSLTTEQVAEKLRTATLVALPCIVGDDGNVDALPTALLEGMACGLPLVSTRLSGIPEIVIDGRNGLLVEPGNSSALAAAIGELLTSPARAAGMGLAGRRRAEALFDLRSNVARLAELLRPFLETPGLEPTTGPPS
jgi:colanic acid/amylovoran biosynthesis glycosyltransferase